MVSCVQGQTTCLFDRAEVPSEILQVGEETLAFYLQTVPSDITDGSG